MFDTVVKDCTLYDGTGGSSSIADVAIKDGRIAEVGKIDDKAECLIDAHGLALSPGVIDPHVHYDAQILWDPLVSPSAFHGVTSVIGGNCGFSIAPLEPGHGEYLMSLLARVEGMPIESLRHGPAWDWTSFSEWLGRLEGHVAVNAGFFVGHTTVRRIVMGDEATSRVANDAELVKMVALVRAALDAGAIGISSSLGEGHHDGSGKPVPSRVAGREEFLELASTLREFPNSIFEFTPPQMKGFDADLWEFFGQLSAASKSAVLWNALLVDADRAELHRAYLGASDDARRMGGRIVALTLPDLQRLRLSLSNAVFWEAVPNWAELFSLTPKDRIEAIGKSDVRSRLRQGLSSVPADGPLAHILRLETMTIGECTNSDNRLLNSRTIGDVARERGADSLDLLLDIAADEHLNAGFWPVPIGDNEATWEERARIWRTSDVLVGGGDAGAHVDVIDSFSYPTALLGPIVRDRDLLSLEEAVRFLTDVPAKLFGLKDRGRISAGYWADFLLFDPDSVGPGALELRSDLPGGGTRLYSTPLGVKGVWVNGTEIVHDNEGTGELPGVLIRPDR